MIWDLLRRVKTRFLSCTLINDVDNRGGQRKHSPFASLDDGPCVNVNEDVTALGITNRTESNRIERTRFMHRIGGFGFIQILTE